MTKDTVTVTDEIGFHARTASLFAKKAGGFNSNVQVSFNGKTVNGKSMLAIMTLGVKSNASVEISANFIISCYLKSNIENGFFLMVI